MDFLSFLAHFQVHSINKYNQTDFNVILEYLSIASQIFITDWQQYLNSVSIIFFLSFLILGTF